jgi:hypothetical protein
MVRKNIIIIRGVVFGLMSSIVGILLFAVVDSTWYSIELNEPFPFDLLVFDFLGGVFITIVPSIIGSIVISKLLHKEKETGKLSITRSISFGASAGVTIVIVTSFGTYILYLQRTDIIFLLQQIGISLVIASIVGGVSGIILNQVIKKDIRKL